MGIWLIGGDVVIDGSGNWIICDNCPCGGICPTDCCLCCYEYTVSWPDTTKVFCYSYFFGWWIEYTYTLPAGSLNVQYESGADCSWYKITGPTIGYTTTIYGGPGCSGTIISTGSGTAVVSVEVNCSDGLWRALVLVASEVLILGTKTAADPSCPGGSYTNGMTVTCVDDTYLACCPDCTDSSVSISGVPSLDCGCVYDFASNTWIHDVVTWADQAIAITRSTKCQWSGTGTRTRTRKVFSNNPPYGCEPRVPDSTTVTSEGAGIVIGYSGIVGCTPYTWCAMIVSPCSAYGMTPAYRATAGGCPTGSYTGGFSAVVS